MDSHTFTALSNGKIFPKGEIFMSLNGDFYSVCRATQYLFWNLVWKWEINFVERDEGAANQNFCLFWAEKKQSQREKDLLASLSLWLVYTLQQHFDYALYWQTSETYERKSKSINILAILQYHILTIDIIHDYLAWRKKIKLSVNFWKKIISESCCHLCAKFRLCNRVLFRQNLAHMLVNVIFEK